jgi:hypothetical protein
MKKQDWIFIVCCLIFFGLFFFVEPLRNWFLEYSGYRDWRAMLMAFLKFGVLATLGESIGLRIQKGMYNCRGFGLLPRAVVWGFLGMGISMAMTVFSAGMPEFLGNLGIDKTSGAFGIRLLISFCISVAMNLIFAPVFMTLHKVTDTHIMNTGGTVRGLFSPIPFRDIFTRLNWGVLYGFVFKKTIPLFWIPAHTITFMLPAQWRVLFAALLGVVLGVLLSTGAIMGQKKA